MRRCFFGMWLCSGNLLSSKSAHLNRLQDVSLDDIFRYIVNHHAAENGIIGHVDTAYVQVERSDLDVTIFLKVDCDLNHIANYLNRLKELLKITRIDTVVLVYSGNLYTEKQQDLNAFHTCYQYLLDCPFIDSIGVFEFSPEQLQSLKKLPKYVYIDQQYCCIPPQALTKFCKANDIEILAFEPFHVNDIQSLGYQQLNGIIKYIVNIKSRSICTHQGYILDVQK